MKNDKNVTAKVAETIPLGENQRVQILVAQMNERYQACHQLRDRSTQFTLWILGFAVAASWWLLQEPSGNLFQNVAATALVLILGFSAFYFLKSMGGGFRKNREVLINIETALGLHTRGTILQDKIILPPEYKNTKPRASAHFSTLYVLLLITSIYLLSAIWIPLLLSKRQSQNKIEAVIQHHDTEKNNFCFTNSKYSFLAEKKEK